MCDGKDGFYFQESLCLSGLKVGMFSFALLSFFLFYFFIFFFVSCIRCVNFRKVLTFACCTTARGRVS